jgi:hypothetical protein
MGRIKITLDVYDESADEQDGTGLTLTAFDYVERTLRDIGDDISVERID